MSTRRIAKSPADLPKPEEVLQKSGLEFLEGRTFLLVTLQVVREVEVMLGQSFINLL